MTIPKFKNYRPKKEDGQTIEVGNFGSQRPTPSQGGVFVETGDKGVVKRNIESEGYRKSQTGYRMGKDGDAEFQKINIRGTDIGVRPGDSIQDAIDLVITNGGGAVRLAAGTYNLSSHLDIDGGVKLVGAGRGVTILDFGGGAYGVRVIGTIATHLTNFSIEDLTIQNSNHTAGIYIDFCDFFRIENIEVKSCDQIGIRIEHAENFSLNNTLADSNTSDGFRIVDEDSNGNTQDFILLNCLSVSNGGVGYNFDSGALVVSTLLRGQILNCTADSNTGDGFQIASTASVENNLNFIGCFSLDNGARGFDIQTHKNTFISCYAYSNTGDGFDITGAENVFFACSAYLNATDFDINSDENIFLGTRTVQGSNTSVSSQIDVGIFENQIAFNFPDNPVVDQQIHWVKNVSGGTLNNGDVVILASTAAGDEVTTTATAGDDKVFGVMKYATTVNNAYGSCQVLGKITTLRVDGTTDIAVGDFLTPFTTAKIAAKAAAGDMVFAIALEAYTTNDSNGVIDALLIQPRLI